MRLTGCRLCDVVRRTGAHVSKRQEQIHNAIHRRLEKQVKPKRTRKPKEAHRG